MATEFRKDVCWTENMALAGVGQSRQSKDCSANGYNTGIDAEGSAVVRLRIYKHKEPSP